MSVQDKGGSAPGPFTQATPDFKKATFEDIERASQIIGEHLIKTQVSFSQSTSELLGVEVFLKHENEQKTGSFKSRGAFNRIWNLSAEEKKNGIIASSAGNHAQGVAFSAGKLGIPSRIVMPQLAPAVKVEATESYGSKVILHGHVYDEAFAYAKKLADENNYTFVHPFMDQDIVAGQGTLGVEIFHQIQGLDSVVVPIGGGGLISGVALALKTLNPQIKIYGVVAELAPTVLGLYHKNPEAYPFVTSATVADGIAVKVPSTDMMDSYIRPLVDDIVAVSDEEVCQSMVWLMERCKTVVEGCGATTLAAARKANWDLGEKTCLLLSGGNIDLNLVSQIIEKGLIKSSRLARFRVVVEDRPGELLKLVELLSSLKANVLEVNHDRLGENLRPREASIEFLIECSNSTHLSNIQTALEHRVHRTFW